MNYRNILPLVSHTQAFSTDYWNDFGYWNDGTFWYEKTPTYTARVTAYATATGITDYTILDPLNIFDLGLTYYGLDTIMKAVYPMVTDKTSQSDMANQMKYNFMNPLDTDAAFRLNWIGGWTYSANGALPNGTNAYANTSLSPSTHLPSTNAHISYYSRTITVGSVVDIGGNSALPSYIHLRIAANFVSGAGAATITTFTTTTDARGLWMGSKRASNDRAVFRNGVKQNSNTNNDTNTLDGLPLFLAAQNNGGTAAFNSSKECAFASIGDGLTDQKAEIFSTLVNNLQKALNRAVY